MKIMGLELVVFNIPLERRLQTAAVLCQVLLMSFLAFGCTWLLLALLFTPFAFITWLYAIWYIYDFKQPSRGGRRFEFFRRLKIWNWVRDYFPIRLVTTSELDPKYNYIIGAHPHGIMGTGMMLNFGTEANDFSKRFPGITVYNLGLKSAFYAPGFREFLMARGICDVSEESINHLMKKPRIGITITVGGAKEALDANPGLNRLVLKSRKGFVKMAVKHGAHLVPIYTFGENDLFHQVLNNAPGTKVREWQRWIQLKTGVAPVLFFGRGVFNYTFGFMPRRVPLTTVVGRPIPVERDPSPSPEYINDVHERYKSELKNLFDSYKAECGYPDAELEYID